MYCASQPHYSVRAFVSFIQKLLYDYVGYEIVYNQQHHCTTKYCMSTFEEEQNNL